ncbi:MAG: alcohol dehydrogenase [Chlamydiae bacterium GWC2_50_10]|nr:MAG: alcohol dehydrogenase [Chlamydiae bacterium GWA2_50_15]OGN53960.1 MAG: alcohol dehydrogenase [Chlamydiae bacterium GWF2_49_8]OGN54954.1 MAG: alcohol dehydrogenase [Chlamydiae bacterium GWC2_50_10]HAZ15785.1 alcohol dehydrogenase [Parachlamydiales bacterium]HCJ84250.1 alcohol dehydrogenase [Parachlamydiales bacterium]
MLAMLLTQPKERLRLQEVPLPEPQNHEVRLKIFSCGVCRTDLHIADGELPSVKLPLILGHQIVGRVEKLGKEVSLLHEGERIGVPWLAKSCGICPYCQKGEENLCDSAQFTGYTQDGGFAEYALADERYCIPLGEKGEEGQLAPLLCAGLIGYRSYKLAGAGKRLGLYGFGASAHILAQLAKQMGKELFAFTRPQDVKTQAFAKTLGVDWVGGSDEMPPVPLDAALIFAPVGALVPRALQAVKKGGRVVCVGIRMSDIPSFPYALLWGERHLLSVANLTRKDGEEFFELIRRFSIQTKISLFPLREANEALDAIRTGSLEGAAVLSICKYTERT